MSPIQSIVLCFLIGATSLRAQTLLLPPRSDKAISGGELIKVITPLSQADREARIFAEISQGNVPAFLRALAKVSVKEAGGGTNSVTLYVTPDYLAVGSDEDYFLTPLSPLMAQKMGDLTGCVLPTRKLVNDIYTAAAVKLPPTPIPPTPAMTTVPVFAQHNEMVRVQRGEQLKAHLLGELVAGDKKDVVVTAKLASAPGKVAIYGWHRTNGVAIQPLYLGHADSWVDYSHGIRLVQQRVLLNGEENTVTNIMRDPKLAGLLSDEGVVAVPRYAEGVVAVNAAAKSLNKDIVIPPLQSSPHFEEQTVSFSIEPQVKVHINAPSKTAMALGKKVKLVIYALPNGNTIEQTIGKKLKAGDDWHFDIQHIGAQMRFVRELCPDSNWVVVYLEAGGKSWPAWRKQHDSKLIPTWIEAFERYFQPNDVSVILSGHSGGGSLIFGYINSVTNIPNDIERITFLDSNYAYDEAAGHTGKLMRWLEGAEKHFLTVLAYHDDIALLDGKTFVSAAGGTWGRSHRMLKEMALPWEEKVDADFERYTALNGRVKFILRENPEKKIYHTVQVEKNGFIHCLVSGTAEEGKGYEYFGARAYERWIQPQ